MVVKKSKERKFQGSIEDHFSAILSEEIKKEIDEGILSNIMTETGWIRVDVDCGSLHPKRAIETAAWIHQNAQGDYKLLGGCWHFLDPKDAVLFTLRWT